MSITSGPEEPQREKLARDASRGPQRPRDLNPEIRRLRRLKKAGDYLALISELENPMQVIGFTVRGPEQPVTSETCVPKKLWDR